MRKPSPHIPFRRIFHYYWIQTRKYRWSFFVVFTLYALGFIGLNIVNPLFYRELIDGIVSATRPVESAPQLFRVIMIIAGLTIFSNGLHRLADYVLTWVDVHVTRELANDAFSRLQPYSYRFFANTFSGSLVAQFRRFVDGFSGLLETTIFNFWASGIQLVVMLVVVFFLSPVLGLLFLIWTAIFTVFVVTTLPRQQRLNVQAAEEDSRVTGRIADVITNILNVKMFASADGEKGAFWGYTERLRKRSLKADYYENFVIGTQGFLMGVLQVAGIYLAVRLWLSGSITAGTVVLVQVYVGQMFGILWPLGRSITRFNRLLSRSAELADVFEQTVEVTDPKDPEDVRINEGTLTFDNATFRYGDSSNDVFRNFNLTIPSGERVGIVGHSGAGKTTITKLILRFADVQGGAITIDGQDIRNITQDGLRSRISYVPQEPLLFHRSLRENIAYGKPDVTEEEVIEAAKKAHAHEFISGFPQGYDTLVGERGVKLSGGERQRVAIARAMLKDAPIIILDEATSSLDSESEKYIQEAFDELMKGKTTIVIAHRLSTIQKMDRILVLENGEIVEDGTHAKLLEKRGAYHSLWSHQTAGFIE